MLRGKGAVGGNELMQPLRGSRERGQAEATTDPMSAWAVGLLIPHFVAWEDGIIPFLSGGTQLGTRERATSIPSHRACPITLWVSLWGCSCHHRFGVLSGISQGHITTDPTNLSAWGASLPSPCSRPCKPQL